MAKLFLIIQPYENTMLYFELECKPNKVQS